MDMKQRGLYIARQLSFHGVTFHIEDVPLDRDFINMYNAAVKLVSYASLLTEVNNVSMSVFRFVEGIYMIEYR
jgi:hypothetical protein